MILTDKEIEEIKTGISEGNSEDYLEENSEDLKKQRLKIGTDSIILAKLFITALDYLVLILPKAYSDKVIKSIENTNLNQLRELLENYSGGAEFGDYHCGEKIKIEVNKNRTAMLDVIDCFFKICGEEI